MQEYKAAKDLSRLGFIKAGVAPVQKERLGCWGEMSEKTTAPIHYHLPASEIGRMDKCVLRGRAENRLLLLGVDLDQNGLGLVFCVFDFNWGIIIMSEMECRQIVCVIHRVYGGKEAGL